MWGFTDLEIRVAAFTQTSLPFSFKEIQLSVPCYPPRWWWWVVVAMFNIPSTPKSTHRLMRKIVGGLAISPPANLIELELLPKVLCWVVKCDICMRNLLPPIAMALLTGAQVSCWSSGSRSAQHSSHFAPLSSPPHLPTSCLAIHNKEEQTLSCVDVTLLQVRMVKFHILGPVWFIFGHSNL